MLASFRYDAFGRQLSGPPPTIDDPVNYVDPNGALAAIEFRLLIRDIAAAITSIDAAFSGDVKALLAALAGQLFGTVVPCGIPASSG